MKCNDTELLKIYSGLFEVRHPTLELPIMTLDMSIMSEQKTINGIATIVHDLDCGNIVKSNFRSTSTNCSEMNDGSFVITCIGYPVLEKKELPSLDVYETEVFDINHELPNFKMMLKIDPSWSHGLVAYKFRTSCYKKWINIKQVSLMLNQDGLKKVA